MESSYSFGQNIRKITNIVCCIHINMDRSESRGFDISIAIKQDFGLFACLSDGTLCETDISTRPMLKTIDGSSGFTNNYIHETFHGEYIYRHFLSIKSN